MSNVLKSQGKNGMALLIENQLLALPIRALAKPFRARADRGGAGPRVPSMPLPVTPCVLFGANEAKN